MKLRLRRCALVVAFSLFLLASMVSLVSCANGRVKGGSWFRRDGSSVLVELEANATTGYGWVCLVDGSSVAVVSEQYVPSDAPSSMVGVGGLWKCRLDAVSDGASTVAFSYVRPWDASDVADSKVLSVVVSNGRIVSAEEIR